MHASHHTMFDEPPAGLRPLDASVVQGFRRAAHLNRQMFMRLIGFEKHGRPGRATLLLVLGSALDGISQREIADILHVSPPTVSVMLQKMEQHGLIERWTDEADQRVTRARMTPKGRELADSIQERYRRYIDAALGTMPDSDRTEFARLLDLFADNLERALKNDTDDRDMGPTTEGAER